MLLAAGAPEIGAMDPRINPERILHHLKTLQRQIRDAIIESRETGDGGGGGAGGGGLAAVTRVSAADTIYGIDATVEPIIEAYCQQWGKECPLVVVAEGIEPESGAAFPHGTPVEDCVIRVLMDPIDGTRGIMYDKRPAWALACAAPNKGSGTQLSDAIVSVMTELPTSKMGYADVLWAIKGKGAQGERQNLAVPAFVKPLKLRSSTAETLAHGFASVANFFPATKVLASELMEFLVEKTLGKLDATKAQVFDDQYICTGGQFYELLNGHDRFIADLRPAFYNLQGGEEGLCCHPYDCAGLLVAQEAGALITDETGKPLDAPFDTTTSLSWIGYANPKIKGQLEPLIQAFLKSKSTADERR